MITVTVPDVRAVRVILEEQRAVVAHGTLEMELCAAVFAATRRLDVAAKCVRDPLHAVTDAQNRNALRQDLGSAFRRVGVVDGTGTA